MCDSKDLLVAFLYDELAASERRAFESHLSACAECRDEVAGLRATRGHIALWTPPDPDFAFTIVRGAAAPPRPSRFRVSPAWGLAAAAVLVLALGAAIANVEVRYGSDGLVVRTGWSRDASSPLVVDASRTDGGSATAVAWKQQVDALEQRLRQLEAAASQPQNAAAQTDTGSALSDAEVIRRVRAMISDSEKRQQHDVALRVAQISREFDAQRRVDLTAVDQAMARLQNTNGAEAKQYRAMMQQMYRASYQPK